MHAIAGKAVAFGEALRPEFKAYTNMVVNKWNLDRLNELPSSSRLVRLQALVRNDTRGVFVPILENGIIRGSANYRTIN